MSSALDHILNSPSLPSLPNVAVKLLDLSRNPSASQNEFVEATQSDPAISAKILKLANSSYLGLRSDVTTIKHAVSMLGTRTVTSLALGFSIARQSVGDGALALPFKNYWQRSVFQALACEVLSAHQKEHSKSELFLAGLMLDIGTLAMLKVLGGKYADLLSNIDENSVPQIQLEHAEFGFDHTQAGSGLLQNWSFPPMLVEGVGRHHGVGAIEDADPELQSILKVTRVAAAVADYFFDPAVNRSQQNYLAAAKEHFNFEKPEALDVAEAIAEAYRDSADNFDADAYALPDPADLMAAANQQLAEIVYDARETQKNMESQIEVLKEKTIHDPLTGVNNRAFFDEVLAQQTDLARRDGASIGVIFFDIDHFKQFNDTYGHQFGDDVLCEVARVCRNILRDSDTLARYGGEEFVVLAQHPTCEGLAGLCERLRAGVESAVLDFDGQNVSVTISVGAAYARPEATETNLSDRLISQADAAMYDAKNGGRNRCQLRDISTDGEKALQAAISARRFTSVLTQKGLITEAVRQEICSRPHSRAARRTGTLAVDYGLMEPWQLDGLLSKQRSSDCWQRFGEVATEAGVLEHNQLVDLLAVQSEDPSLVAQAIIERGLVAPDVMAKLVEEYMVNAFGEVAAKSV